MDNMITKPSKLDALKWHLRRWNETHSISEAADICDYLYKELRAGPKKGADVTIIIVKEG
jgi:hypothetical protein